MEQQKTHPQPSHKNKCIHLAASRSRRERVNCHSCNFTHCCKSCISRGRCSYYKFSIKRGEKMDKGNCYWASPSACNSLWTLPGLVDFSLHRSDLHKSMHSIRGGFHLHYTFSLTKYWKNSFRDLFSSTLGMRHVFLPSWRRFIV